MPQFHLDTSGAVLQPTNNPAMRTYVGRYRSDDQYGPLTWDDLDSFTQGYVEALFFTSEERLCEESNGDRHMPDVAFDAATMESRFLGGDSFGFSDLAPEALASIIADCAAFQRDNAALLAEAYARDYDATQAGRDYWFTRNGHGVGFWDREALKPQGDDWDALRRPLDTWSPAESALHAKLKAESLGERLSAACRHDSVDAYLGDDGKVYV